MIHHPWVEENAKFGTSGTLENTRIFHYIYLITKGTVPGPVGHWLRCLGLFGGDLHNLYLTRKFRLISDDTIEQPSRILTSRCVKWLKGLVSLVNDVVEGSHCVCFWLVQRDKETLTRAERKFLLADNINGTQNETHFTIPHRMHGNSCSSRLAGLQVPEITPTPIYNGPVYLSRVHVYMGKWSQAKPGRGGR
jgi:hypothetical protein